jgi:hypothetical protein
LLYGWIIQTRKQKHSSFGFSLGLDDDFNYKEELDLDAALKR